MWQIQLFDCIIFSYKSMYPSFLLCISCRHIDIQLSLIILKFFMNDLHKMNIEFNGVRLKRKKKLNKKLAKLTMTSTPNQQV